jgi:two-component system sensor histidine kinase MprB
MRALEPERALEVALEEVAVAGEHGRLRELALILIDNAVKYSPPDMPVEVAVSVRPARLTVRDHGPGMSGEDAERAFDRFFRGTASTRSPGSGLGLAIARAGAERYGAEVALEPATGGGTRAVVTFPDGGEG